jgi:hypothetical protein
LRSAGSSTGGDNDDDVFDFDSYGQDED